MAYPETHPVTIWRLEQAQRVADECGYLQGTRFHADAQREEYDRLVAGGVLPGDIGSAGL